LSGADPKTLPGAQEVITQIVGGSVVGAVKSGPDPAFGDAQLAGLAGLQADGLAGPQLPSLGHSITGPGGIQFGKT